MTEETELIIQPDLPLQAQTLESRQFLDRYRRLRTNLIHALRQTPAILEQLRELSRGTTYRIHWPPGLLQKVESGEAIWRQGADGFWPVVVKGADGKIIKHLQVEAIPPDVLATANQLALQSAIAEVIDRLEVIEADLEAILRGQHDDRIAKVKSGIELYHQAFAIEDELQRRMVLTQSIGLLNEGRNQLVESLKSEISFIDDIPESKQELLIHSIFTFRSPCEVVRNKAKSIQHALETILRASSFLVLAYGAINEPEAAKVSLAPLIEVIQETAQRGIKMSRFLPYQPEAPPEELWQRALQAAESASAAERLLTAAAAGSVDIVFEPYEIIEVEKEDEGQ
jgi:hypothetical protein